MPKMKTHRGVAKRIKVTGSGQLRRAQAGRGHGRLAKGKDSFRRLRGVTALPPGDRRRARRLIGR